MSRVIESVVGRGGQTTVPAEVRRWLGIELGDRISFVIGEDGCVKIEKPMFPTVESLRGIAGKLPAPMEWDEMLEIALNDAYAEKHGLKQRT